jgi:hypothetical protein
MANDGCGARTPGEFFSRMGGLLLALVAGEDLRVRQAIARVVARAHPGVGSELRTRRHAGNDLAANPRVE